MLLCRPGSDQLTSMQFPVTSGEQDVRRTENWIIKIHACGQWRLSFVDIMPVCWCRVPATSIYVHLHAQHNSDAHARRDIRFHVIRCLDDLPASCM